MNNKILKKIILIITILAISINNIIIITKATEKINFRNITIDDGLSQATVETIIQDQKGYIWIGTNDGLNRYNGNEFKVYRHQKNDKKTIVNNYITDLKEDLKGYIWVGTTRGLSKINQKGEVIKNYTHDPKEGNLSHYNIWDILVLRNGIIMVSTEEGLNVYDEEKDSFYRVLEKKSLSSQLIHALDEDSYGNIWLGTSEGINKINVKEKKVEKNFILDDRVYEIYCDGDYVWAGTFSKGASRINIKTNEINTYYDESWGLETIPGEHIKNFFRDSTGTMWISSNNGLIKYDEKENKFEIYKNKIYDKTSLVNNNVFTVLEDRSGLLWVGTYSGISTFDLSNTIKYYGSDPFDEKTLNDNMVQAIYEDDEGYLWIGTNSKGVNILSNNNDRIKELTSINTNFILGDSINDITGYKEKIFLGSNNGLICIDKKNKISKVINENNGLVSKKIRNLLLDNKGYLWIGTDQGYNIMNISTYEIININYILDNLNVTDKYSGALFQDSSGEYWIGSFLNGGLVRINPNNKNVMIYKYDENDKNTIIDNSIRVIAEDSNGLIWIGTSNGLCSLDKNTKNINRYTVEDGLANNNIYGILLDDDDNPWVSTNSGISKYDIKDKLFINLNLLDGLQSNEFNGEAYFKTKDGEFYFGGINGMNSFYPQDIKNFSSISKVIFDEFYVNGIKIDNIDNKNFKYDENNITIKIFLPDYKNNKNTRYYYNINDEGWTLIDGSDILFSKLASGKYNFKVMAINNKGVKTEVSEINFKIKPTFWFSIPAIIIYILIISLIIFNNRRQVKKLDHLVDVRTQELTNEIRKNKKLFEKIIKLEKNKNSYFINLSHELRTPLNVLSTTEQLITKLNKDTMISKEKLSYYMSVIRRNNSRLLNLINNLIDISKIEHGKYIIKKEKVDIVFLVEEAALSLKEYVEEKGIDLIIDPDMEEKIIFCDSQDIERCVVNLVSNSVKFTQPGGRIEVFIKEINNFIQIIVSDTGKGIEEEYQKTIFDRFNQIVDENSEITGGSGLGLTITRQIIELHGGRIFVNSIVGKGSKFIIEIPFE